MHNRMLISRLTPKAAAGVRFLNSENQHVFVFIPT